MYVQLAFRAVHDHMHVTINSAPLVKYVGLYLTVTMSCNASLCSCKHYIIHYMQLYDRLTMYTVQGGLLQLYGFASSILLCTTLIEAMLVYTSSI